MIKIKDYLFNNRGELNTHMGIDLFATLMLVFLITTSLLLNAAKDSKDNEEKRTPSIDISLPKENQSGFSAEKGKAVAVSARHGKDGGVEYFVDKEKTSLEGVSALLKGKRADRVELRLEDSLTNAVTIMILGQLQQANIRDIYYIFVKN